MRSHHLLFALPLGFFACISQNNASDSDDAGGFDASFDAAIPLPEAAPGVDAPAEAAPGVDAPAEAAPIAEASIDAPIDSGPPAVNVVVAGVAGLEQGISVVWSDSTGTVLGTSTTDVTGTASSTLATVSMATVVMGTSGNPYLYTVMGLELGETVPVADVSSLSSGTTGSFVAEIDSVPTAPTLGDGGPVGYSVAIGSISNEPDEFPATFNLSYSPNDQPPVGFNFSASSPAPVFPVLVEARDSLDNPLGFAFSNTNTTTETLDDAGYLPVSLTNPWLTTMTTQSLWVSNNTTSPTLAYSEVADGVLTPLTQESTVLEDGGVETYVTTHTGFAEAVQAEAWFGQSSEGGFGAIVIATSMAPPTADGSLTLDATPVATAPAFQSSSVDLSTPQLAVSWTLSSGTLASSTAVVAVVTWYGENEGGTQNGIWTIVSPGTSAATLTAPAFPPSLAGMAPPAGASSNFTTLYAIAGQGALSTYPSLLPTASLYQTQSALCEIHSPAVVPLPALGSIVMSLFTNEGGC